ncbi:transposon Tf2-9 polyprotein [Trichonephila clavipes]|nr:transposon Tf2-9 polyprotein [Trichonephila clavipes]
MTPLQLLTGVKMKTEQDLEILKLLEEEIVEIFSETRVPVSDRRYRRHLTRTQFGPGLKLRPKFFGSYEVVKVKPKDRCDGRKIGLHEGPNTTSTAADHMQMSGETV